MKIVLVQFVSWDKMNYFNVADFDLKNNDKVIVKTDSGTELGEVIDFLEVDEGSDDRKISAELADLIKNDTLRPIIRIADREDLEDLPSEDDKINALEYSKKVKKKYNLPMKFVDVHYSFDGSKLTFAFIADGRVDFRSLVKDMTRHFSKTIRLQQIGIRDEAKITGDIGPCGKNLCCKSHLKKLVSITSDMADIQQCSHRGSDRISGVCGRLMCCLSYEQDCYEKCAKRLPAIGRKVSVDGRRGTIVGRHILKESVDVEFPAAKGEQRSRVEVDLNRNKKKK